MILDLLKMDGCAEGGVNKICASTNQSCELGLQGKYGLYLGKLAR
jgi:hypothetical protein